MMEIANDPKQNKHSRWVEVQFYFLLIDLFKLRGSFNEILAYITFMKKVFNPEIDLNATAHLASRIFAEGKLKLFKDEYAILCWLHNVPLKTVQRWLPTFHWSNYVKKMKHFRDNPEEHYFHPRYTAEDHKHMMAFLTAVELSREVGITWTTKFFQPSKRYSRTSAQELFL